jgi:hypothetical protein
MLHDYWNETKCQILEFHQAGKWIEQHNVARSESKTEDKDSIEKSCKVIGFQGCI